MSTLVTGNVITDATITREKLAFDPFISVSGFRNKIINGDFRVWQRGISFSDPTNGSVTAQYTADRWQSVRGNWVTGITTTRSTDAPTGFQYSLKQQRVIGNTNTIEFQTIYCFETKDIIPLQGSQITVSYYAKKGINFSSNSSQFTTQFTQNTTTVDGRYFEINTGGSFAYQNFTLNTNWARYYVNFTINNNAKQAYLAFTWTPTGTAGADDSLYITGVQSEAGNLTDFEFRPYDIELPLCQRYYTTSYRHNANIFPGTSSIDQGNPNIMSPRNGTLNVLPCQIRFPVQLRRAPTVTIYKPTDGVSGFVESTNQDEPIAVSSVIASQNNISLVTLASNPTPGRAFQFQYTANAELDI